MNSKCCLKFAYSGIMVNIVPIEIFADEKKIPEDETKAKESKLKEESVTDSQPDQTNKDKSQDESSSVTPDVQINVEHVDEIDIKPHAGSPVSSQDSGMGEDQLGTDEDEFDLGEYFGTRITLNMGRPPKPDEIALDDEVTICRSRL